MPACFQHLNPNCLLCANYSFPLVISIIIITEKPTCSAVINTSFHSVRTLFLVLCWLQLPENNFLMYHMIMYEFQEYSCYYPFLKNKQTSSYCLVTIITAYQGIITNRIPYVYSVITSGVMFNNAIHCKHSKLTRCQNIGGCQLPGHGPDVSHESHAHPSFGKGGKDMIYHDTSRDVASLTPLE